MFFKKKGKNMFIKITNTILLPYENIKGATKKLETFFGNKKALTENIKKNFDIVEFYYDKDGLGIEFKGVIEDGEKFERFLENLSGFTKEKKIKFYVYEGLKEKVFLLEKPKC
jgi:hypothetical protein